MEDTRDPKHLEYLAKYYLDRGVGESTEQRLAYWDFFHPASMSHNPAPELKLRIYEASQLIDTFPQDFHLC